MKKIHSLFIRDTNNPKFVTQNVDPKCQWVLEGEGVATRKFDGSACLVKGGMLYRRYRLKPGRSVPAGWIHWNFESPESSGHGWLPVSDAPSDDYHREAWNNIPGIYVDGTYELVGPKIQNNAEGMERHTLIRHGSEEFLGFPRDWASIQAALESMDIEGIVWDYPGGGMAKIKKKDFGLQRKPKEK